MTYKRELPERESQMAEFSVGHDGLRYHYKGYRYDKRAPARHGVDLD